MKAYKVTYNELMMDGHVNKYNVVKGYYINKEKAEAVVEELKKNRMSYSRPEIEEIEIEE